MMPGIGSEVSAFLQALLAGNLVCLIYEAIRVLRRIIRHHLFWISVEDLVFWLGTGFYLFWKLYQTSYGMIRWYFVLGVLLGGLCTHWVLSRITKKYLAKRKKRE